MRRGVRGLINCALNYLNGYPDVKVIDPIQVNYPACTMPLTATSPAVVTPQILSNTRMRKNI